MRHLLIKLGAVALALGLFAGFSGAQAAPQPSTLNLSKQALPVEQVGHYGYRYRGYGYFPYYRHWYWRPYRHHYYGYWRPWRRHYFGYGPYWRHHYRYW